MRNTSVIATGCAVVLLSLGNASFARECLVHDLGGNARLLRDSGEMIKLGWRYEDRCERIRLVTGRVAVYFFNAATGKYDVVEPQVNDRLLPSSKPEVTGEVRKASSSMWDAAMSVLRGDQHVREGVVRGAVHDAIAAALPDGKLAQPAGDLLIQFPLAPDDVLKSFRLTQNARTVAVRASGASAFAIPASELQPGKVYRWFLRVNEDESAGSFTVEPAVELENLLRELSKAVDQMQGDAYLRAFTLAQGLSEHGYRWEARRVLHDALGL